MCLIAFALGTSSRWPLVLAANRDESLARPAAPLARWQTPAGHTVIGGRDLQAGGTWLGLTPSGRIAFLTNVREVPARLGPKSRGELVLKWLESAHPAPQGFADALGDGGDYSGFNLVVGDLATAQWAWLGNRPQLRADGSRYQALPAGVHGVSNAVLNTPWPKTLALTEALTAALTAALSGSLAAPGSDRAVADDGEDAADRLAAPLWAALADPARAPRARLPHTGVAPDVEAALSSAFVDIPSRTTGAYGTRCSTVLTAEAVPGGWRVVVEERTPQPSQRGDGRRDMAGAAVSRIELVIGPAIGQTMDAEVGPGSPHRQRRP